MQNWTREYTKKINRFLLLLGVASLLLMTSCASRKNFVYLNDMVMGEKYPINTDYEAKIHKDDRLGITVSCKNPELAIPFNIRGGNVTVRTDGSIESSGTTGSDKGYRVDAEGYIDFPILGKLKVEGLKVGALKDLIETQIQQGNYIKDPLVTIEFLNFKYTVLGAVGSNGTYSMNGDRITLLEAIAKAGDVTEKARLNRVCVIREVGNERQMFVHDLRSTDLFESPCYYLQQNDIVYVEPKYRKKDAEDRGWQISTLLISLAGLATSIIWAIK